MLDAGPTRPGAAELRRFAWRVDGEVAAEGREATLRLVPGAHDLTLEVEDARRRTATRLRRTLVWRPEAVTRLCFAIPVPDGYVRVDRAYERGTEGRDEIV